MPAANIRAAALAICLAAVPTLANAHPAPFSFLDLIIRGDGVDGALVLHVEDVAHDLGVTPADQLLDPGVAAQVRDRLVALLAGRLGVRTDRGGSIEWGTLEPAADRH